MTVHCPYGGNSLPVEINTIVTGSRIHADNSADYKVVVSMSPVDGFEFEVCSVSDEQDYEPDFGQCGKCGEWVHFPCLVCQARALEAKPGRLPEATEEEALMQHIDHIAENKRG